MGERERDPIDEGFDIPKFEPAATPQERLRQVFQKNDLGVESFELNRAEMVAIMSGAIGMILGGLGMARAAERTWKKTHYHSLFMNDKDAARYFMNYIARRFFLDGGRFGLRVGILSGILTMTAGCLAARRDEARVTDVGIAGTLASFLYRIDVGPKAMLATGVMGGIFWQLGALAIVPVLMLNGYTWDGFYKEARREYYEEENGRTLFFNEIKQMANSENTWPWQLRRRWAQKKYEEQLRLSELRKVSKGEPDATAEAEPKKDQATSEKK